MRTLSLSLSSPRRLYLNIDRDRRFARHVDNPSFTYVLFTYEKDKQNPFIYTNTSYN